VNAANWFGVRPASAGGDDNGDRSDDHGSSDTNGPSIVACHAPHELKQSETDPESSQ